MTIGTADETVASVRGFTRFYTRRLGVLQEALLGSEFNLPEAASSTRWRSANG